MSDLFKLDSDYNKDVCKILTIFIKNIKDTLDISNYILNIVINDRNTIRILNFIQNQLYTKMLKTENIIEKSNQIGENELCGKIITVYNNGVVKYCNIHKYLHINKNIKSQDINCTDHEFIQKSSTQLTNEQKFQSIKAKYTNYVNTLYFYTYKILLFILNEKSNYEFVYINNFQKIKEFFEISKCHKSIYKEKNLYHIDDKKHIKIFTFKEEQ